MKKSYEMAAEEINAKGGIKGTKLALSFEDSTGKPETARAIVEKLIDEEAADHRRRVHLGLRQGRRRRGRGAQDPLPGRRERRRRHHPAELQVRVPPEPGERPLRRRLGDFLAEVVKPKTIAILYESSAFGTSGADAMEKDAPTIGIAGRPEGEVRDRRHRFQAAPLQGQVARSLT